MKVLHITNMYPHPQKPWYGVFVHDQINSLNEFVDNDVLFINGSKSKMEYVKAIPRLKKIYNNYDVIHCHHGWCGLIALFLKNKKVKIVVSLVGGDILEKKILYKKIINSLVWNSLPFYDFVICKSDQMKNICIKKNTNIDSISNGVDLEVFKEIDKKYCKKKLGLSATKKYFLFTAAENNQNRPEKRYDIIKAAMKLVSKNKEFEILFLSGATHEEVPYYINACEAVLLSSDYEGSPNIVKEAIACNIPVISTDVGNVSQMIGDLDHCFIIDQSPEKFAEKITNFVVSQNEKRTSGRTRLEELELSKELVAKKINNIYKVI